MPQIFGFGAFIIFGGQDMNYILIADDNSDITDILENYVKKEGYEPIIAGDGEAALRKFDEFTPVCVLLDVMMPKIDGYEVCRQIRAKSDIPVILITARGEDFERVMGLDIGADDYIVKPFSPSEVMARVRAVLRRAAKTEKNAEDSSQQKITVGSLAIDMSEYAVYISGDPLSLTKKEVETMWTFANNPNKVFSRDNLLDSLWGYDYFGGNRTVDSHIKRLRAKLDKVEHPDWNIKTIFGVGYKFEVEKS